VSANIRFIVYNAYGIGGTVKTVFNFADYFQKTGKYKVEIISVKKTRETPTLPVNSRVKLTVIQDARRGAKYSEEDSALLKMPSELINPEEDLYPMFNGYTDKRIREILSGIHDGIFVSTIPSFNMLSAVLVDEKVLKVGQEHKSYADHTPGIQKMICEYYGKLDALTILTERNKHVYERRIKGSVPIYVLGNGTERLRFRANLKNHVIVAAGRYAEQKGYDMLIRAFGRIADRFPDWILKIYGNGTLVNQYLNIIQECKVAGRVLLEEGTDQLNAKLSEAAFQVCSSYWEPFGMTIIEGFAMGLPCVSFACDGPREIITDGYDGILVQKENVEKLAEAMARVMADEMYRLELGKNAYETAKRYDIRTIGANFEKIVEKEMAEKKRRLVVAADKGKTDNFLITKAEKQLETREQKCGVNFALYDRMVQEASEGKIGIMTILKMMKGWMRYKLSKKSVNDG